MIEFQPWPKLPRLNKPVVVTEKLDGTNAAIIIEPAGLSHDYVDEDYQRGALERLNAFTMVDQADLAYAVAAQSRKRLIAPGSDNFGFAAWVVQHAGTLVEVLGPGRHFGEWWGLGVQRGYGQEAKRFSLFNVSRYSTLEGDPLHFDDGTVLTTVPVLATLNGFEPVMRSVEYLREHGSVAAPGFMRPEGVVAFHTGGSQAMFKAFVENDDIAKGEA